MIIAGRYSFNQGAEQVSARYPKLLTQIEDAIEQVKAAGLKTKVSKEKTMPGMMLFDPRALNSEFKREFGQRGWSSVRVMCDYSTDFYVSDAPTRKSKTSWVSKSSSANTPSWYTTSAPR
jgi:hypothetical protein